MMKRILGMLMLVVLISSCGGDDGGEDENPVITRVAELTLQVGTSDFFEVNGVNVFDVGQEINIATSTFNDVLEQLSEYRINTLSISISGVSSGPELQFIDLGVGNGILSTIPPNIKREDKRVDAEFPLIQALTDASGNLNNVTDVVLYDRANENGDLLEGGNVGVDFILDAFINRTSFLSRARMGLAGDATAMTVTLKFDMSAR